MNDEQLAAQSIRKFVQLMKGLGELAPGLESLGSVKQAEQEAKSRLSALGIDENTVRNRVRQLQAEVVELEKKAKAATERGKADGEAELKRAKAESDAYHAKTITLVKSVESKATDRLNALDEDIAVKQAALDEVNASYKVAKQRLDQTLAELDRIVQRAAGGRGG